MYTFVMAANREAVFLPNLHTFGIPRNLEMNQWIALDISSSSSQSERTVKNTIHCFSKN